MLPVQFWLLWETLMLQCTDTTFIVYTQSNICGRTFLDFLFIFIILNLLSFVYIICYDKVVYLLLFVLLLFVINILYIIFRYNLSFAVLAMLCFWFCIAFTSTYIQFYNLLNLLLSHGANVTETKESESEVLSGNYLTSELRSGNLTLNERAFSRSLIQTIF